MVFSSIRTRLWLTYLFIVVFVLLIAFSGIVLAFQKSPLLYRQVFYRISLVNNFLRERLTIVFETEWAPFIRLFLNEINILDVKIAILDAQGDFLYLSEGTDAKFLPEIKNPGAITEMGNDRILTHQDFQKKYWFYQLGQINDNYFVLTAAERPYISIGALFQDELLRPLFRAGIIALIMSFALGWVITQWITEPLAKISASASRIAEGSYLKVPIEGPAEVQQLALVINEMVGKVKDSIQSQQDFVANVSHEFKTPLTSIQGFAQALKDEAITAKTKKQKAVEIILDETERLNHLVNDLLFMAKMDAGTINIERAVIDVNELIRMTIEKFQFQIKKSEITIKTDMRDELLIIADGEKISQVLSNLLDNAIKYSPIGSEITLAAKKDGQFAVISFTDAGPGISIADQRRIFERFFQVDKSRKAGPKRGVGLGLSIARQIVMAHGGDIKVKSQLGKGSTFMVKLPIGNDKKRRNTY